MKLKHIGIATLIVAALCSELPMNAQGWKPAGDNIKTRWAAQVTPDNALPEYPRPQLTRASWKNLNGLWDYAVTPATETAMKAADGSILVPFAIESSLSGVGRTITADEALWYRRTFTVPSEWKGRNVLLHFGAVDWECEVFVNGKSVGTHTGGYTAFSFDITKALRKKGEQTLVVKVKDATENELQPHGKQVIEPRSIWYTSVSGIWQTVWMEPVSPKGYIADYTVKTDIKKKTVTVTPKVVGTKATIVNISIHDGKNVRGLAIKPGESAVISLPNASLWTPDDPRTYDIRMVLGKGVKTIDDVKGYTALREVGMAEDEAGHKRLTLNGKILFQYGPLDQGWWPDGLYTAPTDDALRYDLEMTKAYGFNMIRKHIKVEPARWYWWCDKLGIMVWQDMPSIAGNEKNVWSQAVTDEKGRNGFDTGTDYPLGEAAKDNYRKEWKEIMAQLDKFQCIVMWVPFNEAWAQFDTRDIVKFTRDNDASRLVNAASGGNWISGQVGDVLDSHHYPQPKMRVWDDAMVNVLGEYGGIGMPVEGHLWQKDKNWGYVKYQTTEEVTDTYVKYARMLEPIVEQGCSAAVYTQTTDVEGEVNGLMTYDREINKLDVESVAAANRAVIEKGSRR